VQRDFGHLFPLIYDAAEETLSCTLHI